MGKFKDSLIEGMVTKKPDLNKRSYRVNFSGISLKEWVKSLPHEASIVVLQDGITSLYCEELNQFYVVADNESSNNAMLELFKNLPGHTQ